MWIRTVNADLLYITEQPLSHRGPMPMKLCLKVGMMYPWLKFNCGRGMVQDYADLCACPLAVPTMM